MFNGNIYKRLLSNTPWLIAGVIVGILAGLVGPVRGQFYAYQEGVMDANNRVGSLGLNTSAQFDSIIPRANLYITGNVTGGARFQGLVPYASPYEFQGSLGSDTLGTFRRDSVGLESLGGGMTGARMYVNPSRSVTSSFGRNVFDTGHFNPATATPVGASLMPMGQYKDDLLSRPLDSSFSFRRRSEAAGDVLPSGQFRPGQRRFQGFDVEDRTERLNRVGRFPYQNLMRPQEQLRMEDEEQMREAEQRGRQQGQRDSQDMRLEEQEEEFDPLAFRRILPHRDEKTVDEDTAEREDERDMLEDYSVLPRPGMGLSRGEREPGTHKDDEVSPGEKMTRRERDEIRRQIEGYINQHMTRGAVAMRKGDYYTAANAYGDVGRVTPLHYEPHLKKAMALFGAGEYMSAGYFLDRAIQLAPQEALQDIKLSELFPGQKKFKEKFSELNEWKDRTGQPLLMFLSGYIYWQQGELQKASDELKASLKIDPEAASAKVILQAIERKTAASEKD